MDWKSENVKYSRFGHINRLKDTFNARRTWAKWQQANATRADYATTEEYENASIKTSPIDLIMGNWRRK